MDLAAAGGNEVLGPAAEGPRGAAAEARGGAIAAPGASSCSLPLELGERPVLVSPKLSRVQGPVAS